MQTVTLPKFSIQMLQEELARRSYLEYCKYVHNGAWIPARHHRLICTKLEKVATEKNIRLMFFLPPRSGKSMTVTATFPSYYLGKNPTKKVIEVSYGDELATEFGDGNRQKLQEYGNPLFGIRLSSTQATKTNWKIEKYGGGMISVGRGGSITGKGADLLILDDPIKNREEAESETFREKLVNEWQSTIYTRLQAGGSIIIILTRWHEADLAAKLLNPENGEPEPWDVVSLPCLCTDESTDLLGRKVGEPLWPENGYDEVWARRVKLTVGEYAWSSLYQQQPTPAGGSIFKRSWMNKTYKKLPEGSTIIQSWDLPFKESEVSAKCAGIVMARWHANYYFVDVENAKMEFTDTIRSIQRVSSKHPMARAKVIEDKANGPAVINTLQNQISGIVPFHPEGSKEARARAITPLFEAGNVYFPEAAPWVKDFVNDLVSFPNGEFKDTVDATSQGMIYLEKLLGSVGGLIYRVYAQDPETFKISVENIKSFMEKGYWLIMAGVSLGGMTKGTSFAAVAVESGYQKVIVLEAERYEGDMPADKIASGFTAFIRRIIDKHGPISDTFYKAEDGDTLLYRAIRNAAEQGGLPITLRSSSDSPEVTRIRLTNNLLETKRLFIGETAKPFMDALVCSQWDADKDKDTRLSGPGIDTGTLEAFEVTIERDARRFIEAM